MTEQEIIDFKNQTNQLSIEELQKLYCDLETKMSNMILQSDLVIKIALIQNLLETKLNQEQKKHE